ncbi:hypothetical protein [Moorena sp. SIO4A5]|uniref:hypothetical protein n=1 Tax=Moorena sp. SIO4A5 TaxID=2607838 RepID=UPI0013C6752E|nr:hypothetical protein [Moorena sp. SIO4A5]NEO24515.1 hypothetical protein [Moorena sp. SIO4A5]
MMGISKSQNLKSNDDNLRKQAILSYLALVSLWILANVVSEGIEEFSFFFETVFALTQWLVLRRYIRNLGWWILTSIWGWTIYSILIQLFGVRNWIATMLPEADMEIGGVPIGVQVFWASVLLRLLEWTIIGIFQWLQLRRFMEHASWWIPASALGGAVKGGLEFSIRTVIDGVPGALVGACGYGAVTSIVLVLLLKNRIHKRLKRRQTFWSSV